MPTMLSRTVEELKRRAEMSPPALNAAAYGRGKIPVATIQNADGLTETNSTVVVEIEIRDENSRELADTASA